MITLILTLTLSIILAAGVHKFLMNIVDSADAGLETKPKIEFYN